MTEAELETQFIAKLQDLKYSYRRDIRTRAAREGNFRQKFDELNRITRFWQLNRGKAQKPSRRPGCQAACCIASRQRSRGADWLLLLTDAGTVVRVWRWRFEIRA